MNKKAFTLVELIVVITIIAILGTIAFVSFQNYSSQARDTKTISDLNNAHKKVALFKLESGFAPTPDNSTEVLAWAWNIITFQWEFWENVKRILDYGEVITDSEGSNYKYATNKTSTEYSFIGFLESPTAQTLMPTTFADTTSKFLITKGDDIVTILDENNKFIAWDLLNTPINSQTYLWKKKLQSQGNRPTFSSCKEILDLGVGTSDWIYPVELNSTIKNVYCDMTTDEGGWTLAYQYNGNATENDLFANESAFWDISDINTTEAKLSTEDMKAIMQNNKELRFQSTTKNNTFFMKYSDISTLSMNVQHSYNISIRNKSRPEWIWSPYYDTHPHFVLFTGITTNRYPSVCLKNTYDRTEYGVYFEDKKRWRTYCLDGSSTWSPFIKRSWGQNWESGSIWMR